MLVLLASEANNRTVHLDERDGVHAIFTRDATQALTHCSQLARGQAMPGGKKAVLYAKKPHYPGWVGDEKTSEAPKA